MSDEPFISMKQIRLGLIQLYEGYLIIVSGKESVKGVLHGLGRLNISI